MAKNDIDIDITVDDTNGSEIAGDSIGNTDTVDEYYHGTVDIPKATTTTLTTGLPHIDGFRVKASEALDGVYLGADTNHNYAPNIKDVSIIGTGQEAKSSLVLDATNAAAEVTVKVIAFYTA